MITGTKLLEELYNKKRIMRKQKEYLEVWTFI